MGVCRTTHSEKCQDVGLKRCKAIKTSRHERKCHDVNELLCSLKESVQHEEIPASFTVQKCVTVTERVCDTAYDTEITERDDFKCIHVPNTYCAMKERTVYDKTCRTMINFDCKPQEYGYGSSGSDKYGSSGYDSSDSYGGLAQHLNTSARERSKPSVIQLLVPCHLNIVKKEKRKYAES